MHEEWRTIAEFPDYQVSNFGRVKSFKRGGEIIIRQCPRSQRVKYLSVNLYAARRSTLNVHQLVASTFLGSCPEGHEVLHGSAGILDNSVSNLSYGSHSENKLNQRRDGTHTGKAVIRSDGAEFINMHVAAEASGCRPNSICNVCQGKNKTTGGYGWKYKP
jgi:hypothetical protein